MRPALRLDKGGEEEMNELLSEMKDEKTRQAAKAARMKAKVCLECGRDPKAGVCPAGNRLERCALFDPRAAGQG